MWRQSHPQTPASKVSLEKLSNPRAGGHGRFIGTGGARTQDGSAFGQPAFLKVCCKRRYQLAPGEIAEAPKMTIEVATMLFFVAAFFCSDCLPVSICIWSVSNFQTQPVCYPWEDLPLVVESSRTGGTRRWTIGDGPYYKTTSCRRRTGSVQTSLAATSFKGCSDSVATSGKDLRDRNGPVRVLPKRGIQ